MSVWETIEDAVVQELAGLMQGGSALLATVKGHTPRDRKVLVGAISRERLPAGYVIATSRDSGGKEARRAGSALFSVLLAAGSLRSDDEARTGADDVTGIFTLAEAAVEALQDLTVDSDRKLLLIDERPAGGDEGLVVWEQRYEVRRQSETVAPEFGGVILAGSPSEVHVELKPVRRATSSFSFPGIDGVFERSLGARERAILWRGQLRSFDDTSLNSVESAIEQEVLTGEEKTMTDSWSRSYDFCVAESFERIGPRRRDELTGMALQDFQLEFTQLSQ